MEWPDRERFLSILERSRAVSRVFRLPFRSMVWRGSHGNWMGAGVGSSIDFQDHRPYYPGDDPRHIDWQAYARSDIYSMKLYREEVRPLVDVVVDASSSMFLGQDKCDRTLELLSFAITSSLESGSSVRCYAVRGEVPLRFSPEDVLQARLSDNLFEGHPDSFVSLDRVPFRSRSLRVFITDWLFPGQAEQIVGTLMSRMGQAIVLAPFSRSESAPEWSGNIRFIDCEGGEQRLQLVTDVVVEDYLKAYRRHFELVDDVCTRKNALFARVSCSGGLKSAFMGDAALNGVVELWV